MIEWTKQESFFNTKWIAKIRGGFLTLQINEVVQADNVVQYDCQINGDEHSLSPVEGYFDTLEQAQFYCYQYLFKVLNDIKQIVQRTLESMDIPALESSK